MTGAPTDNNATLFAQGYNAVLEPLFARAWKASSNPAGTWDPPRGDRVPAGLHRPPEDQRGPDRKRRERRADHPLPEEQGSSRTRSRPPARTPPCPDCRTSSPATSAARSTSRSTWRPRPPQRWRCTCGLVDAADHAGQRHHLDTAANVAVPSVLLDPEVGHADQHEVDGHRGPVRPGLPALRRRPPGPEHGRLRSRR